MNEINEAWQKMQDKKKKIAICNILDCGWGFQGMMAVYHLRYADWKRLFPTPPKRLIVIKHLTWITGELVENEVDDFRDDGLYLVKMKKATDTRHTFLCFENQEFYYIDYRYYFAELHGSDIVDIYKEKNNEYLLKYKRQTKIDGLLK